MNCLDSSFLVDLLDGQDYAADVMSNHVDASASFIPTIVLYELYTGVLRSDNSDAIPEITESLDWAEVRVFDESAAHEAAQIRATLLNRGDIVNPADILIAGIARSRSARVVTTDTDFGRIPGLAVLNPQE